MRGSHPCCVCPTALILDCSGVGKSTFINCFRGLTAHDEGAAAVGLVETTNEPTPYEHPDFSHLKIWDLPGTVSTFVELHIPFAVAGVGTPNYPQSCYLEKVQFQRYDFFLIICRTRFTGIVIFVLAETITLTIPLRRE